MASVGGFTIVRSNTGPPADAVKVKLVVSESGSAFDVVASVVITTLLSDADDACS